MAGPPARCLNPECAHIFEFAQLIAGPGSAKGIKVAGMTVNCPLCGSRAAVGDGLYDYSGGVLTLKDGPPLTRAMLDKLAEIASRARDAPIEASELLAEIAGVSPELAAKLRKRGLPALAIVLLLLWLVKGCSLNVTIDVNRLIDQATGAASHGTTNDVLETPLPSELTEPTPRPQTTSAAQQAAPVSRQVRRQLERQSKKRSKNGGSLA